MNRNWSDKEKIIAVAAFVVFCVTVGAMSWGLSTGAGRSTPPQSTVAQLPPASEESTADNQQQETDSLETEHTEPVAEPDKKLEQQEEKLMGLLYDKMAAKDLKGAANLINNNKKSFQNLFTESLDSVRYLYDGETLTKTIEGTGLVMVRADTVFYGTFSGGLPNGAVVALQVSDFDTYPRYDYASGIWLDGKMEGEGVTAYHYYQGVESGQNSKVERRGSFVADLMEGDFVYITTTYPAEEKKEWQMVAEQGVTKITDSWIYDKKQKKYKLPSVENQDYLFTLTEDDVKQLKWYNMIKWEVE